MVEEKLRPWDQQPGEPDGAFSWFCAYRSLGPARSVLRAFKLVQRMANPLRWANASRTRADGEQRYAPGNWNKASVEWKWFDRARAFDRHLFGKGIEDAVHAYGRAMRAIALNLEKYAKSITPGNYEELLEGLKLVGSQISPEAYDVLANAAADGTDPPSRGEESPERVPDRPGGLCEGTTGGDVYADPGSDSNGTAEAAAPGPGD